MHCYQIYYLLIFKTNFSYLRNMFRNMFRCLDTGKIIIYQWYSTSL